jgi:hypothetical protein
MEFSWVVLVLTHFRRISGNELVHVPEIRRELPDAGVIGFCELLPT